jgi:UDP-glucose 4-epimerase
LPPNYQDSAFAEPCLRVNALGTLALLEAAVACGISRFVYFSSGNVYFPQRRAVTEDDPIYPSPRASYYLASKACAEVWVEHFRRARGLDGAILRVSSVFGPGMAATGMVPTFAARLRTGEPVTVQDGGRFRADLVHVDDVVDATTRLLERQVGGIFNVGSGRESTALEVATTLASLLGRATNDVRVEALKPGEPPLGFSALDVGRARQLLGYEPRGLRDGLQSYLASLE